jgi:hypothetical protein
MSGNLKQTINEFNNRLKNVRKTQKYKIYTSWLGDSDPNVQTAGQNNTCSRGYTFIRDYNRDGSCLKCPSGKKLNLFSCHNKNRPFAIKKPSCPNNTTLIYNATCADNKYKSQREDDIVTTPPSCPSGSTVHVFRGAYVCASCPSGYTGISQTGYCMTPSEVKNDTELRNESVYYKSIKLANESFENVKKCENNDYAPLLIFIILLLAVILCLKYNF